MRKQNQMGSAQPRQSSSTPTCINKGEDPFHNTIWAEKTGGVPVHVRATIEAFAQRGCSESISTALSLLFGSGNNEATFKLSYLRAPQQGQLHG